ncbi:MAG: hypothetical protein PVG39_04810 [Desulfobacteraceae bacterium]|jgi:hypothetical protein
MFRSLKAVARDSILDSFPPQSVWIKPSPGWENASEESVKPGIITAGETALFSCFFTTHKQQFEVTNLLNLSSIKGKRIVDVFLLVALRGIMDLADGMRARKLKVTCNYPQMADHLLDNGFSISVSNRPGSEIVVCGIRNRQRSI